MLVCNKSTPEEQQTPA